VVSQRGRLLAVSILSFFWVKHQRIKSAHILRRVETCSALDLRFKFHKRSQLFIGSHNEPLPVIAMRISNEDCSPAGINRCNTAPTPTGFAETVGDYFPQLTLVWFFSLGSVDFVAWANGGLTALLARGAGLWRGF
jgi:hypothetical protein